MAAETRIFVVMMIVSVCSRAAGKPVRLSSHPKLTPGLTGFCARHFFVGPPGPLGAGAGAGLMTFDGAVFFTLGSEIFRQFG